VEERMTEIIEWVKTLLGKEQPLLTNLLTVIGLLSALFAILHFSGKALKWLYRFFTRENLYRHLKPYFSRNEILRAIGNYIPTQCQNVDPAVASEPARVHAFAPREKLIPFFIKKVFKEKKEEKYYLVLADSGMGKTTFMINLFLKYMRKRFKRCEMVLLPLGDPKSNEKIDKIENKPETILLLDAFDEDIRAAGDYRTRMEEIIDKTPEFQTVVITSRTQFFPSDPDIPDETGLYKFGGNKGIHRFYRLYVSPFNRKDINRYLRRKYPVYRLFKRFKARSIVEKSPDLMVRPMLLANIEDLLERKKPYEHTYDIYEEMVQRWIDRERVKDKKELRRFSEVIARDMYENQQARGGLYIDKEEIGHFARDHHINLEDFEMRSRSLLNRDAEGKYKFAHKSILEYLLSLELLRDPVFRKTFNYDNMEQTERFFEEQFFPKITAPFFSRLQKGSFRLWQKKGEPITGMTGEINIKKLDLSQLEKIAYLDLSDKRLNVISPLKELKNIQTLHLSNNRLTDISPLKELKKIQRLYLSNNQLSDISPLKELKKIQRLYLSNNQLTDISPLKELINIQHLRLSYNQLTDISPLKELKSIQTLWLEGNQLTDISPLKELINIQHLRLSYNQITDISPLMELKSLRVLHLRDNPIKDRGKIEELKRRFNENANIYF
jgi:hypothetical protein